jgi:hypothetical protein
MPPSGRGQTNASWMHSMRPCMHACVLPAHASIHIGHAPWHTCHTYPPCTCASYASVHVRMPNACSICIQRMYACMTAICMLQKSRLSSSVQWLMPDVANPEKHPLGPRFRSSAILKASRRSHHRLLVIPAFRLLLRLEPALLFNEWCSRLQLVIDL